MILKLALIVIGSAVIGWFAPTLWWAFVCSFLWSCVVLWGFK